MSKSHTHAFTLVEVLIVAIIAAVLAVTIVPQVVSTANEAKLSTLRFNLQTVRSQLEIYRQQHLGRYPPAASSADFSNQLTRRSDPSAAIDPANGGCGPYIEDQIPANPFNRSRTVTIVTGTQRPCGPVNGTDGWQYNPTTGWFYPNSAEYFAEPN